MLLLWQAGGETLAQWLCIEGISWLKILGLHFSLVFLHFSVFICYVSLITRYLSFCCRFSLFLFFRFCILLSLAEYCSSSTSVFAAALLHSAGGQASDTGCPVALPVACRIFLVFSRRNWRSSTPYQFGFLADGAIHQGRPFFGEN